MGEGYEAGQALAVPTLDPRATREALLAAGALTELDAALQRTAEILARFFSADAVVLHVRRTGDGTFAAPTGAVAIDPGWQCPEELFEHFDSPALGREFPIGVPGGDGIAASIRLGLRGERGQLIGFLLIGSRTRDFFTSYHLAELLELGPAASSWIRPAVLVERLRHAHSLIEIEAELLAAAASAESEQGLIDAVADGIQRALRADLVFLHVHVANPAFPGATLHCAPRNALTAAQWSEAYKTMQAPGNHLLISEQQDGSRANPDLNAEASTPIEVFFRDVCGMQSLLTSAQSHRWGGLGLGISAARRTSGAWDRSERAFLARLSRVLEIAVERLRRGELAVAHAVSLEQQTELLATGEELLATLSNTDDLRAACNRIADRIRSLFDADHVAFGTIDMENARREWLGISSEVISRDETFSSIGTADIEVFTNTIRGDLDVIEDLRLVPNLNPTTELLRDRGMVALIRAPFRLSDGAVGVVSVASREKGRFHRDDVERLDDLCRPMAVAIDRVRLLGRMAESSRMLEAKTRVLSSLGPGATIESAGDVFVREVRRLFDASHATVTVLTRDGFDLPAFSSDHMDRDEFLATVRAARDGERLAREPFTEPYALADLQVTKRATHDHWLSSRGLRSLMRVPLHDARGRLRVIVALGSDAPDKWGPAEVAALADLAQSLGLVTERAALFARSAERAARVRTLLEMLGTFNSVAQPDEIAGRFARQLRAYVSADFVAVGSTEQETVQTLAIASDPPLTEANVRRLLQVVDAGMSSAGPGHTIVSFSGDEGSSTTTWLSETATQLGLGRLLAMRLEADGAPVGIVLVGSRENGRHANEAEEILAAVAGPLAMVIERARVVTTLRQQSQRTQAVLDILGALGPRETLEEVAEPIATALRMMYSADHCGIGVVRGGLVTIAGIDSSLVPWKVGDSSPASTVFDVAEPQDPVLHVINDLQALNQPTAASEEARESGMRSSMRVLIGTPTEPLGVVTVGSRTPGRFTETDAEQLARIVQPVGVVMRYFESRREAERRTRRLEATNKVLTRLSAGGTAEQVAAAFLRECRQLFEADFAGVLSFDHAAGVGVELATESVPELMLRPTTSFPLTDAHSSRLIANAQPHIVADARLEPTLHERHEMLIAAGLHSVMRAPLVVQDEVQGAVVLWARGESRFSAEDADLLGTLTRPLALALEKAAALESLGESELKYRSLVAQAEEMIFLFDSSTHRVLDANSYTARALGYEPDELLELRFDDITGEPPEELDRQLTTLFADGELRASDSLYRRRDGSTMMVDVVASLLRYGGRQAVLVLARDISERKALIGQLIQSQKMDSLGAMAGAVAHDFNNLLTTILGFAGLLKRSRNMDSEERDNLALIEDAARRAADLTGRLLSFSRGGLVRFGRVDLRDVVGDTMQLAEPTMHAGIQVTISAPSAPVYVEGDGGQLQQALTNIVLNARDAMPEGGSLEISLRQEGAVAVLRVVDTGPGMDDEVRLRIFEPFYTTKPVGSGTGLGMAITYGIIQGHHGDITVQSARGRGTTFTISLPVYTSQDEGGVVVDAYNAGEGNLVLVVDDDPMVRRTTTATLGELGYNVVEAPGGSTAVEIVRARPDRFSAVLLDLVMPGMTGSETFRALTAIRPDLPVVVCTGYAADSHIDTDVKRRIAGLVQKPFTAERLGRALEAAGAKPTTRPRI